MNWYILFALTVLVEFAALIMGACAFHAEQHGNTLAMYSMSTCAGLLVMIGAGIFQRIRK